MVTQTATAQKATRGRGSGPRTNLARRTNNRQQAKTAKPTQDDSATTLEDGVEALNVNGSTEKAEEDSLDDNVCWICAEDVKFYSVSECNHRTCHVCALRLRALYKKNECTFCKVSSHTIFYYFRF